MPTGDLTDESALPCRALRDVGTLAALPAAWAGLDPRGIAGSLADVLADSLALDLVRIRIKDRAEGGWIDVLRGTQGPDCDGQVGALEEAFTACLEAGLPDPPALSDPQGGPPVRLVRLACGAEGENDFLLAGSHRPDFPTEVDRLLLGLGASQMSLVIQQRWTESALRASEQRFARFMQHLPGLTWIKDLQGRYVYVNDAAVDAFRIPRERLHGKTDLEIFPPETARQFRENDRQALASRRGIQTLETLEHADGVLHHSLVSKFPIPGADGEPALIGGIAFDITYHVRTQQHLAAQYAVTRVLADAATLQEATPRLLQAVCTSADWEVGAIWEADSSAGVLRCLDVWHVPGIDVGPFEASTRGMLFPPGTGLPGRVWSSGRPAWIVDVVEDRNFPRAAIAGQVGLHGAFAFPVVVGDRITNVIEFFSRETRRPDQDLLDLFDAIGKQVGQFMERRQAEASLRHREQLLRMAQDAAGAGVWEFVIDTGETRWSDGCHRIYGTDPASFVPTYAGWLARIHSDDRAAVDRAVGSATAVGATFNCEFRIEHPGVEIDLRIAGQGPRWVQEIGQTQLDPQSGLRRMAGITLDVTDRKQAEEALKLADRRKDEFLATLAHELRNPLAPLRNALEIMRRSPDLAPTQGPVLEMMERQVRHMVRLVDDLLELSRISRGKIELHRERIDLALAVAAGVEASRPLIESADHELTVVLPDEPVEVEADPVRLAQVIANLLNNAAKYTEPAGHITLTAQRQGREAVVRVRDDGIGIAADMLPRVFEMFTQVDRTRRRSQGGLGIGLALVISLVKMHGGSVQAHSGGPGKGSEFTVTLPLAPEAAAGTPAQAAAGRLDAVRPARRILVVDDNRDAAQSLAMLLNLLGNDALAVYDGPAALEAARVYRPAVVLLDIGMPGMDGYEVAVRLRQQPDCQGVLLVALTGWGQEEDRRRSYDAGFDHHLIKPVDVEPLQALIASLEGRGAARAGEGAIPSDHDRAPK